MYKTSSENNADVTKLVEVLRQVSIGETIDYRELDAIVGRPVRHRRYLLVRAMDQLNKEAGTVFASVWNVGVRRLPIDAIETVGSHARTRIRNIAKRGAKKLSNAVVRANDVPGPVSLAINRELAVLGVLQSLSRDRMTAKTTIDTTSESPTPVAVVARRLMEALQ